MAYKTANRVGVSGRSNIGRTTTASKGYIYDGGRGIHVPMNPSGVRFAAREDAAVLVIIDQMPAEITLMVMQWDSDIEGGTLPAQGDCFAPIVSDVSDESIHWAPIWLGRDPWVMPSPQYVSGPNMMLIPLITNIGFALIEDPAVEDPMDPWEGPPYRAAANPRYGGPRPVENPLDYLAPPSTALEATIRYTPVYNYHCLPKEWFPGASNYYQEPW